MKKFVFLMFFCTSILQAQEHAWVYFKNKPNAETYLSHPLTMLSQRAIDRRSHQNIEITAQDVPVDPSYILSIKNSEGITVKAISKWLNAVHVFGLVTDITALKSLTFVDSIQFASKNIENNSALKIFSKTSKINKFEKTSIATDEFTTNQVNMLGVEEFHHAGFQGQGLQIAVIDAGFYGVNTAEAFYHLLDKDENNGEILGGYDFVNNSDDFYTHTGTTHGTQVLSTIGAVIENEYMGTAPKASFYLFVTEDSTNESPLEESLWVQAAEKADSLGVDIINTSLGYSQFDESKYDYTYEDMDGATTFISRGAYIASQKGMVLVNSIGNSGNDSWKYLTAPADAKNIIAVGAVNATKNIVNFSSYGPTSDGRIKPETLAQGGNVYVVNEYNEIVRSNGTSFSGPIIAGVVACLWQAYPQKTSIEIRDMVIANSEMFLNPTDQEGYGVLNLKDLTPPFLVQEREQAALPFYILHSKKSKEIQLHQDVKEVSLQVISSLGSILVNQKLTTNNSSLFIKNLFPGIYYLKYMSEDKNGVIAIYIN